MHGIYLSSSQGAEIFKEIFFFICIKLATY